MPEYINLSLYTTDDVKNINSKNKFIGESSKGDKTYLEYNVPRSTTPIYFVSALVVPIPIPKFQFSDDAIKYVFIDDKLVDIQYDYYKTHSALFFFLPFENFGIQSKPYGPTFLWSEKELPYNWQPFTDTYNYQDAFFAQSIKCDFDNITINDNNWNIYGMKFTAHFTPKYKEPKPNQNQSESYIKYECNNDKCEEITCHDSVCEKESTQIPEKNKDIKTLEGIRCASNNALSIQGLIYQNTTNNKEVYTVHIIKNKSKNFDLNKIIDHIDYNGDRENTSALKTLSKEKYNKTFNKIDMTIIHKIQKKCYSVDDTSCYTYDIYKSVFFDKNNIYYLEQLIVNPVKEKDYKTEFENILLTIKIQED